MEHVSISQELVNLTRSPTMRSGDNHYNRCNEGYMCNTVGMFEKHLSYMQPVSIMTYYGSARSFATP